MREHLDMAARVSAAASRLPESVLADVDRDINVIKVDNVIKVGNVRSPRCAAKYSFSELIQLGNHPSVLIKPELKAALGRLGLLRTAGWRRETYRLRERRKRRDRRQKRGKRSGLLARLKANNRPALPTLFLSNVRALNKEKMDLLRLRMNSHTEMRKCCVLLLTETWAKDNIPDAAFQMEGLLFFRADRDRQLTGKTRGGGLCAYINKQWCTNCSLISSRCSDVVEYMTLHQQV